MKWTQGMPQGRNEDTYGGNSMSGTNVQKNSSVPCRSEWAAFFLIIFITGLLFAFTGQAAEGGTVLQSTGSADTNVLELAARNRMDDAEIVDTGHGFICVRDGKSIRPRTGWFMIGKQIYYCRRDRYVHTGAFSWNGKTYRAKWNGRLYVNSWYYGSTKTCYYGEDGVLVTKSWKKINGKRYYFDRTGNLLKNAWADRYYVDSNGVLVQGLKRSRNTGSLRRDEMAGTGIHNGYVISKKQKLIISGASRVVQMFEVNGIGKDVVKVAKGAQKYRWFRTYALHVIRAWLDIYPNSIVVLQFGHNDLNKTPDGNFEYYRKQYAALIRDYPDAKIWVMDSLPRDQSKFAAFNRRSIRFNRKMKAAFPDNYLGGYDFMVSQGFETYDGIHYSRDTYRMIYQYILDVTGWRS